MNLTEFAALRAGDKIDNHMSHSRGEVVDADDKGVNVRWTHGSAATTRHYSVASTIWFHWSRVVEAEDGCACGGGDLSGHDTACPHK